MDVKFLSPARNELKLAIEFYEKSSVGLGSRFLNEVKASISRIVKNPQAWSLLDDKIRRCRLQRFPYGIVYGIEQDAIVIVSVMHLHRHPQSWQKNLNE
jgi:plasmid stabilization system protein ParE